MESVGLLQTAATVLLNSAFGWLAGTLYCAHCLRHNAAHRSTVDTLWRSSAWAALACLCASFTVLLCALALMGDVGLGEALGMLPQMLRDTAYGRAGLGGLLAIGLLMVLCAAGRRWLLPAALLLMVFALTRASISHAGENGLLTVGTAIEWAHLALAGLWIGVVAVAGWIVLPAAHGQGSSLRPFLGAVSSAATLALAGVVLSGLYNAWQRIASVEQMLTHPYGNALGVKLVLVGIAVGMGAYNRLHGFPAAPQRPRRAILVLRIESAVLLGALLAAALLTLQEPPR
ncbi:MAG: CopD family protein [Pseudomonadota bacterium]